MVLYYSYSGNCKRFAEAFAAAGSCVVIEIQTEKPLSKTYAYAVGCAKAISGKPIAIKPLNVCISDTLDVFAPIWAGHIAPPITAALKALPKGTGIKLHCVSLSGESNRDLISKRIAVLGLELLSYEDIKSGGAKQ
ncbi:MAG: hypothetical protein LBC38_04405 [Oscillospiraceae bacterium]|jgi:hypothetical protein|nr:hypothetical protein [Oscillospiraceae bacterium]